MIDRTPDPSHARDLQAANSPKEPFSQFPATADSAEPVTSVSDRPSKSSGLFRQVLVAWFAGSEVEPAFRQAGQLLEHLLAKSSQSPETDRPAAAVIDAGLRAIAADLIFLARFLQESIDVRQHSTLDAKDWELARTAGHQGAHLLSLRKTLLAEVPLEPAITGPPQALEDFIACRETALWPIARPEDRQAIRTLTALLHGYAREVQVLETPTPEPAIRRDARAAAVDLRYLSDFVLETAELVEGELAEGLVRLGGELVGAAGRLIGDGSSA